VPVVAFGPHVHPDPGAPPRWGGRIVLDPVRARSASYPAIDPVHTVGVGFSSDRHRALAERVRAAVAAGGPVGERSEAFLTQPFRSAEPFLGRPGVSVALVDTLDGVERLLDGDVPKGSLRYVGPLASAGSWPVAEGAPF